MAESLIPVWGSGKEAIADYYDRDYLGAVGNSLLAISDVLPVKAAGTAAAKASFKLGARAWRDQRRILGAMGIAQKAQPVHHWLIPQGRWGKAVPPQIKNMLWNTMPTTDAIHGSLHGYRTRPKFGPLQQFFYGTPTGFKIAVGSGAAHAGQMTGRAVDQDRKR